MLEEGQQVVGVSEQSGKASRADVPTLEASEAAAEAAAAHIHSNIRDSKAGNGCHEQEAIISKIMHAAH